MITSYFSHHLKFVGSLPEIFSSEKLRTPKNSFSCVGCTSNIYCMFTCTVFTARYLKNVVENAVLMLIAVAWCVLTEELSTRIRVTVLYPRLFLPVVHHRYVFLILLVLFLTNVMLPRAQFCKCLVTQPYVTFASSTLHDGLFNTNHLPPSKLTFFILHNSHSYCCWWWVFDGGGFARVELVVVWLPCSASSWFWCFWSTIFSWLQVRWIPYDAVLTFLYWFRTSTMWVDCIVLQRRRTSR